MSKLVNWGHWIVAGFLTIQGISTLWMIVVAFPRAWRHPDTLIVVDYITVGLCALFFACAWGIIRWRRWAHTCTFALLLFELVDFVVSLATVGWFPHLASFAVEFAIPSAVACVWLMLPTVRTTLAQRQQFA